MALTVWWYFRNIIITLLQAKVVKEKIRLSGIASKKVQYTAISEVQNAIEVS